MSLANMSVADRVRYVPITIPSSVGPAVTIESLVLSALNSIAPGLDIAEQPTLMGGSIPATGTAYLAGNTAATCTRPVAATEIFSQPAIGFLRNTFVISTGAAIPVVIDVWLGGDRVYTLPTSG